MSVISKKQYIIRGIQKSIDLEIRKKAKNQEKSINKVLLELISSGLGLTLEKPIYHDLDFLIGTMTKAESKELRKNIQEQNRVDLKEWK